MSKSLKGGGSRDIKIKLLMTHNRVMLGYVVGTKLPKSHWLIEI